MRLHTPQAQFGMLLFSASHSLTHLPRLLQPTILAGFTIRLRDSLQLAVQSLLTLTTLTDHQRAIIVLPVREGGLGLVSAHEVLSSAYVASHGSTIRFFKKTGWGESSHLARAILGLSSLRAEVDETNAIINEHKKEVRCKLIDMERPDLWPSQHTLSHVHHRIAANELHQELVETNPMAASWYMSMRLPGAGAFLRAVPSLYTYKVSSELYRVQLSQRLFAPIPGLSESNACVDTRVRLSPRASISCLNAHLSASILPSTIHSFGSLPR